MSNNINGATSPRLPAAVNTPTTTDTSNPTGRRLANRDVGMDYLSPSALDDAMARVVHLQEAAFINQVSRGMFGHAPVVQVAQRAAGRQRAVTMSALPTRVAPLAHDNTSPGANHLSPSVSHHPASAPARLGALSDRPSALKATLERLEGHHQIPKAPRPAQGPRLSRIDAALMPTQNPRVVTAPAPLPWRQTPRSSAHQPHLLGLGLGLGSTDGADEIVVAPARFNGRVPVTAWTPDTPRLPSTARFPRNDAALMPTRHPLVATTPAPRAAGRGTLAPTGQPSLIGLGLGLGADVIAPAPSLSPQGPGRPTQSRWSADSSLDGIARSDSTSSSYSDARPF